MNRNFGKLTAGAIEYAPDTLHTGDNWNVAPTGADYLADGWLRVVDNPPAEPAPDDFHYELAGWNPWGDSIIARYELFINPMPPPRTFSKLKIVAALMEAGVWAQVKAYIEQAGLYDLYLAAQDFKEDNPYFTQGKTALQTALDWTDAQVEAVLAASIAEGA